VKQKLGLDTIGILATMEGKSEQLQTIMEMLKRNNTCYHRTIS